MTSLETITEPILEDLERGYEGLYVVALGGGHGLAQRLMAIQGYADVITADRQRRGRSADHRGVWLRPTGDPIQATSGVRSWR